MPHDIITEELKRQVASGLAIFEERTRDPDVIAVAQYLLMKEAGYTMQQIADTWDVDRKTVYNRVAKWKESGAFQDAEELFLMPKQEEVRAAVSEFVNAWPEMIRKLKYDILYNPKTSPKSRLEMLAWAKEAIVDPELSKQQDPGSAESAYARRKTDHSPLVIQAPSFLKKRE